MTLIPQQQLDFLYDTFLKVSKGEDKRLSGATADELVAEMEVWDNGNFSAAVQKVAQKECQSAVAPTKKNIMRRLFS